MKQLLFCIELSTSDNIRVFQVVGLMILAIVVTVFILCPSLITVIGQIISGTHDRTCPVCNGYGADNDTEGWCDFCNKTGFVGHKKYKDYLKTNTI